jgi:cytochrome P450
LAGSETTATTLSGIINRIVKAPEMLALLTKEVRETFEKESDITFALVKELQYLNAVLWEGFRSCSVL